MVAKLGLLIALAHQPDLLILDEPTSGLDPVIREDFLESILRSDGPGGRTILFSSHHVDDVERIADEVGIVVGGKMVLCDSVERIRDRVKRIRMVLSDGTLPKAIPQETLRSQVNRREWTLTVSPFDASIIPRLKDQNNIDHLEVIDLSLEDIFKDTVRGIASKAANSKAAEPQPC
jgi:ABC-2 type transport system ATP-binding protein